MSAGACRFCDHSDADQIRYGMVKYGVRHYAHWPCLIERKGFEGLMALTDWQLGQMPFLLLDRINPAQKAVIVERIKSDAQRTADYLARRPRIGAPVSLRPVATDTKESKSRRCPWCHRMIRLSKLFGFATHKDTGQGVMCYGSGKQP